MSRICLRFEVSYRPQPILIFPRSGIWRPNQPRQRKRAPNAQHGIGPESGDGPDLYFTCATTWQGEASTFQELTKSSPHTCKLASLCLFQHREERSCRCDFAQLGHRLMQSGDYGGPDVKNRTATYCRSRWNPLPTAVSLFMAWHDLVCKCNCFGSIHPVWKEDRPKHSRRLT